MIERDTGLKTDEFRPGQGRGVLEKAERRFSTHVHHAETARVLTAQHLALNRRDSPTGICKNVVANHVKARVLHHPVLQVLADTRWKKEREVRWKCKVREGDGGERERGVRWGCKVREGDGGERERGKVGM